MLDFFRKYQRYFFVVIAIVIVISFSFFGTHQTIMSSKRVKDYPIGLAVDGSQMKKREIDEMSRFLWSDHMDLQLAEKRMMPNFFNDGVIRKDLFATGLGVMLAQHYFDDLKESLQRRIEKHKQFHPYSHPTAPFISVEMLWGQVLPAQKVGLERFLNEDMPVSPETFSLLVDLYLAETAFPPNVLREYLMFQQKHYNWVQPDPTLPQTNLNLFHCASMEDWFGSDFLELVAQFVHNASIIAKEKGYKVSKEETRVDLFRNGYEALQIQKRTQEVDQLELGNLWREQLMHLGMDEKAALAIWKKVMLMRRLFKDYGHAALLDSHQYEAFHSYASKIAALDHYQLPSALHLADFESMLKLAFYCDAVAEKGLHTNELPKKFASLDFIEKSHPELIQKRFLIEVAEVKKKELAQHISLREMWEWQLEEANFKQLQNQFPELAVLKAEEVEGFFAALEKLSPTVRQKVDHYSRVQIVDMHPEIIISALDDKHLMTKELAIAPNGFQTTFESIENGLELMELLSISAIKGEIECNEKALKARSDLEKYTADGSSYFRIHVLDRDLKKSVLTFAEANEQGILDQLLDHYLAEQYDKVRTANPALFQTESGEWKALEEVKKEVGKFLFKKTLLSIDRDYIEVGGELSQKRFEDLDAFYPQHYLYHHMRKAQKDIRRNGYQSAYLAKSIPDQDPGKLSVRRPLAAQWELVVESKTYKNHESSPWFDESLFAMVERSWSSVQVPQDGKLNFFELKEKSVPEETYLKEIKQGREILSVEAQRFLMTEILDNLKAKQAIHLSKKKDVE